MLTTILLAACAQSIEEIESTLKAATTKASYENGAYDAARSLAEIRTADAAELRIELFDTKQDTYRGVYLRDWFYSGYLKSTTLEEGDVMLAAAANKKQSIWHRITLLRGIERSKAKVSSKLLLNKNFLKDKEVCRAWQQCAGVLLKEARIDFSDGKQSSADLLELFSKAGAPYYAYAHLPQLTAAQEQELISAAQDADDSGDRAIAMRILAQQAPSNIIILMQIAEQAFEGNEAGPRTAALEGIVDNELFAAAPLLIRLLKQEVAAYPNLPNRFVSDISASLRTLTGLAFGSDPVMWEKWWDEAGAGWLANAKKGIAKDSDDSQQEDTVAQFFGIPVDSSNIAILVDGSGSMSTSQLNGESCAAAAATEVEKFLAQLPKKALFTVATIEQAPEFAFKKMMSNSKKNRKKALDFLAKRPYRSTSALYDALEEVALDLSIDTVLIVSDGGSSAGKHQYSNHILDGFERMYLRTGLRVHCVLVTDSNKHERFLRDLAAISGGKMSKP